MKLKQAKLFFILLLALTPLSSVWGSSLTDLLTSLENQQAQKLEAVVAAYEHLSNGNRPAAANDIATVLDFTDILHEIDLAQSEGSITAAQASQLEKAFSKEVADWQKLYNTLNDVRKSQTLVYNSFHIAYEDFFKTEAALRKIGAGGIFTMAEVNAKTAGFHNPGDIVSFKISGLPEGCCLSNGCVNLSIVSTAINLGYTPVYGPVRTDCDTFTMTMGPDQGGAFVVASFPDGQTRKWGLFNYGKNGSKITNAAFQGCYTASAWGSITVQLPDGSSITESASYSFSYCLDAQGHAQITQTDFEYNFANGSVKISNGYLSCNINYPGLFTFSMNGALTLARDGGVYGSGTWSISFSGGSGGGGWSVKRTS